MSQDTRIVGIMQARMSSTRLPGKVMKPLLGEPMLTRQVERLLRSARMSILVIATSDRADDDVIAAHAEKLGVPVFRGSLSDVLDRYYQAAKLHDAAHVLRTTADCPFIDPTVMDLVIDEHLAGGWDYTTNNLPPSWPHGLDLEVMTMNALAGAWQDARLPDEREHVTPFIRRRPERFRIGNVASPQNNASMRWTVDEPEDYEFTRRVYEALYPSHPDFSTTDVLNFLRRHPEVVKINEHHSAHR